jgi:GT2 family glycosyltransferase
MKKTAVVILNWNGKKLLEQFLPSVIRFSPDANIYVADNNSDDDSINLITTHFPMVKIIRNTGNFGYAKGYNEALKFVEEEIYALVNSDVEVTQNWLEPIVALFDNDPEAAIIQPKILDYRNKQCFEYAGAGGGFIDKFGYPYCRGRIFSTLEKDEGQYDDEGDIFWASGACFFIRKEIFRELKGFDGDFFAHQEEIDLCWRAINKGYKVKYCGKSAIYHVGGATLDSHNPQKTFLNFRNSLRMLVKNVPQRKLFGVILTRLFLDGAAGFQFLLKGKWEHTIAIIKAHFSFYMQFGKDYDKRGMFQQRRYYRITSIAWCYFVKKKTNFHSLF